MRAKGGGEAPSSIAVAHMRAMHIRTDRGVFLSVHIYIHVYVA